MNRWGWVVVITLALTALAWVAPGFVTAIVGELGTDVLRWVGVVMWPVALLGYGLLALHSGAASRLR